MLHVVAVQVGNYLGRGAEYLARLFDGVQRHMPADIEWKGVCLTDDPDTVPPDVVALRVPSDIKGWWAKIYAFNPDVFKPGSRCLFFDLDTIIVGDLRDLATYDGPFAAIRDFYHPIRLQSAVMAWEAGIMDNIWHSWDAADWPQADPRGDQFWIETQNKAPLEFWQDFIPEQVVSYKVHCQHGVPDNARVVCYHGKPRPHETALWNERTDVERIQTDC